MLETTGRQRERAPAAASRRQDGAWWALLAVVALLALAAVLGRHQVARTWLVLGWWHWGPPVLCAVAGTGALGLRRPPRGGRSAAARGAPPAPRWHEEAAQVVEPFGEQVVEQVVEQLVEEAGEDAGAAPRSEDPLDRLAPRQLVEAVAGALRADGWEDPRLDPDDPSGTLLVARRGGTTLLVRCHHEVGAPVTAAQVAELVGARACHPGAEAVIASIADPTPGAREAALGFGVGLVRREQVLRWLAGTGPAQQAAAGAA